MRWVACLVINGVLGRQRRASQALTHHAAVEARAHRDLRVKSTREIPLTAYIRRSSASSAGMGGQESASYTQGHPVVIQTKTI